MIHDRLRPARGRGELRADVPRHRENGRTSVTRKVADDADVATPAETAGTAEWTGQGVFDGQTDREQDRSRPVVGADPVVGVVQERSQNGLWDLMSPCRELVEDEV